MSPLAYFLSGGLKRIADVSAWLVPFMGGLYFLAVLLAVLINYDQFFPAIGLIFAEAFNINSAVSGVTNYSYEELVDDVELTKLLLAHRLVSSRDAFDTQLQNSDETFVDVLVKRVVGWI